MKSNNKITITKILFVSTLFIITQSCSQPVKNTFENENIKTELPQELSKNKKLVIYFETLNKVVDQYALMVEKISKTAKENKNNDSRPEFKDAVNIIGDITSSSMQIAPLLDQMQELEKEAEVLKESMTEAEVLAFTEVYTKIILRFSEMRNNLER